MVLCLEKNEYGFDFGFRKFGFLSENEGVLRLFDEIGVRFMFRGVIRVNVGRLEYRVSISSRFETFWCSFYRLD